MVVVLVKELIAELLKTDQEADVWIDTDQGLMEIETMYLDTYGNMNTVIISYTDPEEKDNRTLN